MTSRMNIHEATAKYEAWAARHLTLLPVDLDLKHTRMAEGLSELGDPNSEAMAALVRRSSS